MRFSIFNAFTRAQTKRHIKHTVHKSENVGFFGSRHKARKAFRGAKGKGGLWGRA